VEYKWLCKLNFNIAFGAGTIRKARATWNLWAKRTTGCPGRLKKKKTKTTL
jgi:hypothetical protein